MSKSYEKMNAILTEIGKSLAERDELLRDMAVALLTRRNLFILGKNGQAKSAAIRYFAKCISDAQLFTYQMNKATSEEDLFGRLDLSSIIPGGVALQALENDPCYCEMRNGLESTYKNYSKAPSMDKLGQLSSQRKAVSEVRAALSTLYGGVPSTLTRNKIPEADIAMLDEIFKANGSVLNALLTALNERRYVNEGQEMELPTVSFFAASNELPNLHDPEERDFEPLLDRFDLKVQTDYIQDKSARQKVLKDKVSGAYQEDFKSKITLAELARMQAEVLSVKLPAEINDVMDDILTTMRARGLPISDRKFFGYIDIARANAWLEGRDTVQKSDLMHLVNYLWMALEDIPAIHEILADHCLDRVAVEITDLKNKFHESYRIFEGERAGGGDVIPALLKLRLEMVEAYREAKEMLAHLSGGDGIRQVQELIEYMESKNQEAHRGTSLTYVTLDELALLN